MDKQRKVIKPKTNVVKGAPWPKSSRVMKTPTAAATASPTAIPAATSTTATTSKPMKWQHENDGGYEEPDDSGGNLYIPNKFME